VNAKGIVLKWLTGITQRETFVLTQFPPIIDHPFSQSQAKHYLLGVNLTLAYV